VFPQQFPWHQHWRGDATHVAIPLLSTEVDHVRPGSRGGEWLAVDNLVVTCPRCNSAKLDYTLDDLGWRLLEVSHPGWDGLTRWHRALWEAAGRADHQRPWLRALESL
jgi:5-methylcytosine-specific restriction endonuclease McrA